MRPFDVDEIDPEVAATLDAIDATLAGEPVDARYAEVAEIALLLATDRPQTPPDFAGSLDERVARRFASAPPGAAKPRRRRPSAGFWQATGALTAGVAMIVAIVVVAGSGHGGASSSEFKAGSSASAPGTVTSAGAAGAAGAAGTAGGTAAASIPAARRPAPTLPPGNAPAHAVSQTRSVAASSAILTPAPSTVTTPNSSPGSPGLQPPTSGRKVVQSAQLSLDAPPNRIDAVAQQVYDVVGALNGIVESSTVTQTGGPGGYADFQLSVPSSSLGDAMTRLSALNYAQVASRTDNTQDITDQYNATTRALADARALRTSLLRQLANATTTEQVDSINAQIHDAEASISSDLATLNRLNHSVNFSQLEVTVNAHITPAPVSQGGGGFTLGRAAHDAGRVLTVVAGVALIVIAALTPVGLLAALAWWIGAALRRRRREQALDSV